MQKRSMKWVHKWLITVVSSTDITAPPHQYTIANIVNPWMVHQSSKNKAYMWERFLRFTSSPCLKYFTSNPHSITVPETSLPRMRGNSLPDCRTFRGSLCIENVAAPWPPESHYMWRMKDITTCDTWNGSSEVCAAKFTSKSQKDGKDSFSLI